MEEIGTDFGYIYGNRWDVCFDTVAKSFFLVVGIINLIVDLIKWKVNTESTVPIPGPTQQFVFDQPPKIT